MKEMSQSKRHHFPNWIHFTVISDFHIGVLLLQALRVLSCDYKMENETRMVVCDLGNPMVAGTNVRENQMHLLIFILIEF